MSTERHKWCKGNLLCFIHYVICKSWHLSKGQISCRITSCMKLKKFLKCYFWFTLRSLFDPRFQYDSFPMNVSRINGVRTGLQSQCWVYTWGFHHRIKFTCEGTGCFIFAEFGFEFTAIWVRTSRGCMTIHNLAV